MGDQQYREVTNALVEFVKRVSAGDYKCVEEVTALPEVAAVLYDLAAKWTM